MNRSIFYLFLLDVVCVILAVVAGVKRRATRVEMAKYNDYNKWIAYVRELTETMNLKDAVTKSYYGAPRSMKADIKAVLEGATRARLGVFDGTKAEAPEEIEGKVIRQGIEEMQKRYDCDESAIQVPRGQIVFFDIIKASVAIGIATEAVMLIKIYLLDYVSISEVFASATRLIGSFM